MRRAGALAAPAAPAPAAPAAVQSLLSSAATRLSFFAAASAAAAAAAAAATAASSTIGGSSTGVSSATAGGEGGGLSWGLSFSWAALCDHVTEEIVPSRWQGLGQFFQVGCHVECLAPDCQRPKVHQQSKAARLWSADTRTAGVPLFENYSRGHLAGRASP